MNRYPLRKLSLLLILISCFVTLRSVADETVTALSEYTDDQVIAETLKYKKDNDIPRALQFLSEELDKRAKQSMPFRELSSKVWREAQVNSGRLDAEWSAMLYDAIYQSSKKNEHYGVMDAVAGNLLGKLRGTGRNGRYAEVLETWFERRKSWNHVVDISAYADQGGAYDFLPQVRKRNVPEALLYSQYPSDFPTPKINLGQQNAHVLARYALLLGDAGKWRQCLEWNYQIRSWASLDDGKPRWQLIQPWFDSVYDTAYMLQWMGFYEEALTQVDSGLAAPMQESYHGRKNILFQLLRLEILMEIKQAPDDVVDHARALLSKVEQNIHLSDLHQNHAKLTLARALLYRGATEEAMSLLDQLAALGHREARIARVRYWIDHNRLGRVEEELLQLIKNSRLAGSKVTEIELYQLYADFLELSGRLSEALLMRREIIRLCHSFDFFTKLPVELAKLAVLLERLGDPIGSKAAADEARKRMEGDTFLTSRKELTEGLLSKLKKENAVVKVVSDQAPPVDIQPEKSIVIPIEGASWTSIHTLTNPSNRVEEGTLSSRGLPVVFARESQDGDVLVYLATQGKEGSTTLKMKLEPQNFRLLKIRADEAYAKRGEISLVWTASQGDSKDESMIVIETPEKGVSGSIIQASRYRANPFYGVPVYLHYVTKDKNTQTLPMRFVTSETARVEVYDFYGIPMCVDGQGNGSLRDKGDELFETSDGDGNLSTLLTHGTTSVMIVVYPNGPLPKDGLKLTVEVFQDGAWSPQSENLIQP